MKKVIKKTLRHEEDGVSVAGDIHAAISVNEGGSSHSRVSSRQRIVQRSGKRRARDETPQEGERGEAQS